MQGTYFSHRVQTHLLHTPSRTITATPLVTRRAAMHFASQPLLQTKGTERGRDFDGKQTRARPLLRPFRLAQPTALPAELKAGMVMKAPLTVKKEHTLQARRP